VAAVSSVLAPLSGCGGGGGRRRGATAAQEQSSLPACWLARVEGHDSHAEQRGGRLRRAEEPSQHGRHRKREREKRRGTTAADNSGHISELQIQSPPPPPNPSPLSFHLSFRLHWPKRLLWVPIGVNVVVIHRENTCWAFSGSNGISSVWKPTWWVTYPKKLILLPFPNPHRYASKRAKRDHAKRWYEIYTQFVEVVIFIFI